MKKLLIVYADDADVKVVLPSDISSDDLTEVAAAVLRIALARGASPVEVLKRVNPEERR